MEFLMKVTRGNEVGARHITCHVTRLVKSTLADVKTSFSQNLKKGSAQLPARTPANKIIVADAKCTLSSATPVHPLGCPVNDTEKEYMGYKGVHLSLAKRNSTTNLKGRHGGFEIPHILLKETAPELRERKKMRDRPLHAGHIIYNSSHTLRGKRLWRPIT
ncbi:hypothetical protein J6590_098039 [Homalodisca vitripennis]|nr:hypothetical protein J6590_098039 [Homalodisca vitripennis]